MIRKVFLGIFFLAVFYAGFWVTMAPFAIVWKLVFWNEEFGRGINVALGLTGLIGGALIAFFATRFAANTWKG